MPTPAQGPTTHRSSSSAPVGLILVDRTGQPIYSNSEAAKVICYPRRAEKLEGIIRPLPAVIGLMLSELRLASHSSRETEFMSGKRKYVCRAFSLNHNSGIPSKAIVGVLLERRPREFASPRKFAGVIGIAERFHLTQRESETVTLLADGLTSKEIASRMNVTPNTVKAFVRLIMAKMSVPTRSGIVGKLVKN